MSTYTVPLIGRPTPFRNTQAISFFQMKVIRIYKNGKTFSISRALIGT